jgi:hypothetical protein
MVYTRRLLIALVLAGFLAAGCGDDKTPVDARDGGGASTTPTTVKPPDRTAETRGTITSVAGFTPVTKDCVDPSSLDPNGASSSDDPPVCTDPDNKTLGTVLVEAEPGVHGGDKYSLAVVDGTTQLLRYTASGGYERITFADLAKGQAVDVWIDGPVAESYPAQATAATIVVTA